MSPRPRPGDRDTQEREVVTIHAYPSAARGLSTIALLTIALMLFWLTMIATANWLADRCWG